MLDYEVKPGAKFVLLSEESNELKVLHIEYIRLQWGIGNETGNYAFEIVTKINGKEECTPLMFWQDLLKTNIFTLSLWEQNPTACINIFKKRKLKTVV